MRMKQQAVCAMVWKTPAATTVKNKETSSRLANRDALCGGAHRSAKRYVMCDEAVACSKPDRFGTASFANAETSSWP